MRKIFSTIVAVGLVAVVLCGCGKKKEYNGVTEDVTGNNQVTQGTTKEPDTEPATSEEVTDNQTEAPTEVQTEAPTEVQTEAPTQAPTQPPAKSVYSLLQAEPLNPQKSGYEELDKLIDELFVKLELDGKSNYQKAWLTYLYLVDTITYNRGMDVNAGAYSESDPSVTPEHVLWATDLLNSGMGCCYNYSAAYAFMMRAIGFETKIVTGNVPKVGGGLTPHCWVVVTLGGEEYTFDPDLDMSYYNQGINDSKSRWFGQTISSLSYFYKAENYY